MIRDYLTYAAIVGVLAYAASLLAWFCFWCGRAVRVWEIDRWPVCGHRGGRYTRDNIVQACRSCNAARGVACSRGGCQS